jgi:hypothetical protein
MRLARSKKKRKIEEQLRMIEKRLADAEEYVAQNVNVESTSWLHFADWRGKSGHPLWMKNLMIPATKKHRARKEKALERIDNKVKDKNLSKRKRRGQCEEAFR